MISLISHLMFIGGVVLMSMALRTCTNFFLRKVGTLGILFATYLVGWLLLGRWELGVLLVSGWFFLPWVEILTRVRKLRLPIERLVTPQDPPTERTFPHLSQLTNEVEALQFEHGQDAGWMHEKHKHFFRLFYNKETRCDTAITFIEQDRFAFFYLSFCSRCADGRVFVTWNYPFSYGLWLPSNFIINRVAKLDPKDLYTAHLQFIKKHSIAPQMLKEQTTESLLAHIQEETKNLIALNLKNGLLQREGDALFRYSPNGLIFLWLQFLRDIAKSA